VPPCLAWLASSAERKAGELLAQMERGQTRGLKEGSRCPSRDDGPSPYARVLEESGVTRRSSRPGSGVREGLPSPKMMKLPALLSGLKIPQVGPWIDGV
jgi:hypothetical protein